MTSISDRLAELGLRLPAVKPPAANYVHNTRSQELLLLSGQIGSAGAATAGAVGAGLSAESAVQEAHVAALGLLAALDAAVDGDADRIEQVLRLGVFIAADPDFTGHSQVADGASNLLVAVLGERGRHARTAVGVASLPAGAAVEVDALVRLRHDRAGAA
jgi:enamine deaminase RidA (YjgF/YER057c/UK114 family)